MRLEVAGHDGSDCFRAVALYTNQESASFQGAVPFVAFALLSAKLLFSLVICSQWYMKLLASLLEMSLDDRRRLSGIFMFG